MYIIIIYIIIIFYTFVRFFKSIGTNKLTNSQTHKLTNSSEHLCEILEFRDVQVRALGCEDPAETGIVAHGILDLLPSAAIGHVGQKLTDNISFCQIISSILFIESHS